MSRWAFVFILLPLAGCLSEDTGPADSGTGLEAASLDCSVACNIQATTQVLRQANELSIAVNPLDPLNRIASGKDYMPSEAGECVRDGVYVTFDGGASWQQSNVPGSPWRLFDDPMRFEAHPELSRYWCVTDPVVAFGPDGTAYWSIMPYQCDALSGSKTGDGIHPQGGFNDWFWTCSSMYVLVSGDGGATWPVVREVAFGPRLEHDKQWLSVAPDGGLLLCWDRDPDYQLIGVLDNPAAQLSEPGYVVCALSTDKGRTWSEPTDANPPGTWDGFLPWIDHAGGGTAWMALIDAAGNVLVSSSADGLAWGEPTIIGHYTNPPPNGAFGWPALNGSAFRTFALPTLAVDRGTGVVHVAWMDHSGPDADVLVVSGDGTTWSAPAPVEAPPGTDQFMPVITAGPDGTVDLVWYDTRHDPANHLFDLLHTYSLDNGKTWSPLLRVTDVSSDEQYSHHQNGMVFMGDYNDMDASCGHAYPVWVDTRNMKADAYTAVIERPSARPCA